MSANLVVDLGNTVQLCPVLAPGLAVGATPASGALVTDFADMKDSNTLCNLVVNGGFSSGPLAIQVQCTNNLSGTMMSGGAPASGTFGDPTSGLAQFPSTFVSGGIVWFNSGLVTCPGGGNVSGTAGLGTFPFGFDPVYNAQGSVCWTNSGQFPVGASGFIGAASFQRTGRFVRAIVLSGAFNNTVGVSFLSQLRTTGSGGGFAYSPTSGSVSV